MTNHRAIMAAHNKDSFNRLNLFDEGFVELFSATWLFADTIPAVDTADWTRIASINDLLLWEAAWKQSSPSDRRQFPNAILDRSDVEIWGRRVSNGFDAGVVANVSRDCVGLSNCFGHNAYPAAATLCAEVSHGELPIVGYERGADLERTQINNFQLRLIIQFSSTCSVECSCKAVFMHSKKPRKHTICISIIFSIGPMVAQRLCRHQPVRC